VTDTTTLERARQALDAHAWQEAYDEPVHVVAIDWRVGA
jgi:hypothetical protein